MAPRAGERSYMLRAQTPAPTPGPRAPQLGGPAQVTNPLWAVPSLTGDILTAISSQGSLRIKGAEGRARATIGLSECEPFLQPGHLGTLANAGFTLERADPSSPDLLPETEAWAFRG